MDFCLFTSWCEMFSKYSKCKERQFSFFSFLAALVKKMPKMLLASEIKIGFLIDEINVLNVQFSFVYRLFFTHIKTENQCGILGVISLLLRIPLHLDFSFL